MAKRFKSIFAAFLIYLIGAWPTIVFALPQDGQIVSGSGSITEPTATSMEIQQNTNQMIVNWQSFNIGAAESVNFSQPSSSSIALNRVIGSDPSLLLGKLTANGQVFITNGSGVFFGPGSQVDTHGLVATTMAISDQDFLDRNYNFIQQGSLSSVINEGNISATSYVGLLAPAVENRGTIVTASLGSIDLAAGKAATLDFTGDGLIQFKVTEAVSGTVTDKDGNVLEDRVSNTGLLHADGGQIRMSAKDAGDVIRHVVNMEGMIKANTVVEKDGWVILSGGDSGVVNVSGIIDASGDDAGETGGTVQVTGEYVGLFDNAKVDVSGDAGGGTALIGGDYKGGNSEVQNATATFMAEGASVFANALTDGDGGKIILWANDATRVYGNITATGGFLSGDGGFVETSGKKFLDVTQAVDVSAGMGASGTWLLDPHNVTIQSGAGTLDGQTPNFSPGADNSTIDVAVINAALNADTNVVIDTGSTGSQAGDITINAAILKSAGSASTTLTFNAANDLLINNTITDTSTGSLAVSVTIGGVVDVGANIDTGGGSFTATGGTGAVDFDGGTITISDAFTATTIDISAGTVNFNGTTSTKTLTLTGTSTLAGTGNITVTGDGTAATDFTWSGSSTISGVAASGVFLTTGASVDTNTTTGVTTTLDTSTANLTIDGSSWTNNGTLTWSLASGDNSWRVINGTAFTNAGVFNITTATSSNVSTTGGTLGTFVNSGTLNYSSSGSTTDRMDILANFSNTGTVNVTAGLLQIGDASGSGTDTGTYTVASGSVLEFQNGAQALSGATFNGAGSVDFVSGTQTLSGTTTFDIATTTFANLTVSSGVVNFNATTSIVDLDLGGTGTIQGSGNVSVSNTFDFSAGTLSGVGTFATMSTATTTLTGTNPMILSGKTWNNFGTVNWTGTSGGLFTFAGTTPIFNNLTGATFDHQGTSGSQDFSGTGTFNNNLNATFTHSSSTTGHAINSGVVFKNDGQVNVTAGGLDISSGASDTGDYAVSSGAILSFTGGTRTLNGVSITGAGTVNFSSGTLGTAGGNLSVTASAINIAVAINAGAGGLTFNTTGNITQSAGAITATGTNSFTSTGGNITLNQASNNLGSNLTIITDRSFDVDTTSTLTDLSITVNPAVASTWVLDAANITNFNLARNTATNTSSSGILATALNLSLALVNGLITTTGDINVGTGSLSITSDLALDGNVIGTSSLLIAGSVNLEVTGADADIQLNSGITVTGGSVSITAVDSVIFGLAGSDILANGAGSVTIQSNSDSSGSAGPDSISMVSGVSIDAGSGTITLTSTGSGAGNISLGLLTTTSSSSTAISVNADNGVSGTIITDINAGSTNISAVNGGVVLVARSSIGGTSDATALEIDAATLDASNFSNSMFLNLESDISISNLSITTQANFIGTGNITQTGAITATALTANVTGGVTLENTSNNVTSVSISATGNIDYIDADAFTVNTTNSVVGVSSSGGSINLSTSGNLTVSSNITISAGTGTVALNADSEKNAVGDLIISGTVTVNTNNNALTLQGADVDFSAATSVSSGSAATTLNFNNSTTAGAGGGLAILIASQLNVNVTGDLTFDGVTTTEFVGVGSGTGLVTLFATNDVIFQTTASSHNGALTVKANNDIKVMVDVTTGGNFTAIADNDTSGVGDFIADTGVTVTSSTGNIDITGFEIKENGTLTASSGTISRTETKPIVSAEEQEQVDQGTQSTFTDTFTAPAESGC